MNSEEWYYLKRTNKSALDQTWHNMARALLKLRLYNNDPNACYIHHLMNTQEQVEYNNAHYELWGYEVDDDGSFKFEYGKYVIFVTKSEHSQIHAKDESSNNKRRTALLGRTFSDESREKMSKSRRGRIISEETRKKLSITSSGEHNGMYGKHHTEESKKKMSDTKKERANLYVVTDDLRKIRSENARNYWTDENKAKRSSDYSGENNPNYGKHLSEKSKQSMIMKKKVYLSKLSKAYKEYKESGGELSWNKFQSYAKENGLI